VWACRAHVAELRVVRESQLTDETVAAHHERHTPFCIVHVIAAPQI
jgi:hypothetical protein